MRSGGQRATFARSSGIASEGMSAGWPKVLERLAPAIDVRAAV
jgi:hypothetical protein